MRCRLVHLLRDNVAAGCAAWTNNGCESINHMLKSAVEWRPRKIPDLIHTLRGLVDSQFVDADRALMGRGEFALKPHYAKHRLTVDDWQRMSEETYTPRLMFPPTRPLQCRHLNGRNLCYSHGAECRQEATSAQATRRCCHALGA